MYPWTAGYKKRIKKKKNKWKRKKECNWKTTCTCVCWTVANNYTWKFFLYLSFRLPPVASLSLLLPLFLHSFISHVCVCVSFHFLFCVMTIALPSSNNISSINSSSRSIVLVVKNNREKNLLILTIQTEWVNVLKCVPLNERNVQITFVIIFSTIVVFFFSSASSSYLFCHVDLRVHRTRTRTHTAQCVGVKFVHMYCRLSVYLSISRMACVCTGKWVELGTLECEYINRVLLWFHQVNICVCVCVRVYSIVSNEHLVYHTCMIHSLYNNSPLNWSDDIHIHSIHYTVRVCL